MNLEIVSAATPMLQIRALAIREEMLNYQLSYPVPKNFVVRSSGLGGSAALGQIGGLLPQIPLLQVGPQGQILQVGPGGQVLPMRPGVSHA
jgi:hypothetical protein